ncbi:MAG: hypothetical protein KDD50_11050 [Bdellovibrionales bacterium]|nr:hypothetical protein [Bdellovibrionales bacterium]
MKASLRILTLAAVKVVLFSAPFVYSAQEKKLPYYLCKSYKVVRTIRVETSEEDQCTTKYTKGGIDQIIGRAKSLHGCVGFLENVKGNLEKANWKCRNITNAKMDSNPQKNTKSVKR